VRTGKFASRPAPKIVLIDVSNPYRDAFAQWAAERNIEVVRCARHTALAQPAETTLSVYESMPGEDLVNNIPAFGKIIRAAPLVILAPRVSISATVQLVRAGVQEVIEIPASARDVLARAAARATNLGTGISEHALVGCGPAMRRIRRELEAVAPIDTTVLITGETGTGKGVAARALHDLSSREERPFVQVDCSSLAESVIESELFGHERGAFTGAMGTRAGRFEIAQNGTIFLDEIGELKPTLQAKLLRVLHDREFERIGSSDTLRMSARVVAATNRDLDLEVQSGNFRRDLYFRLNVFRIEIPPLRDRLEDLPGLVETGLENLARRLQVRVPPVSTAFLELLTAQDWPGNVRELMNLLERLLVRHHAGLLDPSSIGDLLDSPVSRGGYRHPIPEKLPAPGSERERKFLEAELRAAGGNISRVARRLGIARSTLRYRLGRYDVDSLLLRD
jgi:DNA-binding NtrC family response regulator